jgi:WD40 repeat protein/serine/threonine protein kinase
MSDADSLDEQFDDLLAAYDEAGRPAQGPVSDSAPPALRKRLERARAVLQLLHPAGHASDTPKDATDTGSPDRPLVSFDPTSGTGWLGKFRIVREIGGGGFGIVFLAEDSVLLRRVALKIPRPEALLQPDFRRAILREAKAAARLEHPNVVSVHEAGEIGPVCYISSAYCPGLSLAQWLTAHREPIAPRDAASLMAILADAVEYAHRQGVIHRDLKPANILLEEVGSKPQTVDSSRAESAPLLSTVPKITDFGLAKVIESGNAVSHHTRTGAILGTPEYMAPEQAAAQNKTVGPAADTYGLGTILYELLTGKPPFLAATVTDILRKVQEDDPIPPRQVRRAIPRDLAIICLTCLRKEPERRYLSTSAFADDLRHFLNGEPILARPPSLVERIFKWIRRRPTTAALAGVICLAVGALFGMALVYLSRLEVKNQALENTRADLANSLEESNAQRAALRSQLYQSRIRSVSEMQRQGAIEPMAQVLNTLRPGADEDDLRGFEWRYLWNLSRARQKLRTETDHVLITTTAWSHDGRLLAGGADDGSICVWEWKSSRPRIRLRGHGQAAHELVFLPDGNHLVSLVRVPSMGLETKRWHLATGQEVSCSTFPFPEGQNFISAVSPDGRLLALGGGGGGKDQTLTLIDLESGLARSSRRRPAEWAQFFALGFSADGASLAAAIGPVGGRPISTVWVADLTTDFEPTQVGVDSDSVIQSLRFSLDKRALFWRIPPGIVRCDLATHEKEVFHADDAGGKLTLSPDSTIAALVKHDGRWTLRLVDSRNGAPRGEPVRFENDASALSFTPDGQSVVVASRGTYLVSVNAVPLFRTLPKRGQEAWALAFSPDSRTLAVGYDDEDGHNRDTLLLWDVATLNVRASLPHDGLVPCLAFNSDGRVLASGCYDRMVRKWDTASGLEIGRLDAKIERMRRLAYNPKRNDLAVIGRDGDTRLIRNMADMEPIKPNHWSGCVAFSPDGQIIAKCLHPNRISVCDVDTDEPVLHLTNDSSLGTFAFAPNGKTLASGDSAGAVALWDLETRQRLPFVMRHDQEVRCVAFSPDGRSVASCSSDRTVRVWQTATGLELLAFTGLNARANCVTFSPDGRFLAAALHDGTVRIWEAPHEDDERPPVQVGALDAAYASNQTLLRREFAEALQSRPRPGLVSDSAYYLALLDRQRPAPGKPDLRGFEWFYLEQMFRAERPYFMLRPDGLAASKHGDPIGHPNTCALAPDGHTIAGVSNNHSVFVVDCGSGKELASWDADANNVFYSPDSKKILTYEGNLVVSTWDASARRRLPLDLKGFAALGLAFSPNRSLIATAGSNTVCLWDAANGKQVNRKDPDSTGRRAVQFVDGGSKLITTDTDFLTRLWSVPDLELLETRPRRPPLMDVTLAPVGELLAVPNGGQSVVELWDPKSLWKPGPGYELKHHFVVDRATASADGKTLCVTGSSTEAAKLALWDMSIRQHFASLQMTLGIAQMTAFSPDGQTLFVIECLAGYPLAERTYLPSGVPDPRSARNVLRSWDVNRLRKQVTLLGSHAKEALSVAFSPDRYTLASAGADKRVILWDVKTGRQRGVLQSHDQPVTSVAFAQKGNLVATASMDRSVRLWLAATCQHVARLTGHSENVNCLAFAPDGKTLASGSDDGTICLWDVATHKQRKILDHADKVTELAYAPDGSALASVGVDGNVRLWSTETERCIYTFPQGCQITTVAFASDSKTVAAGDREGKILLWNTETRGNQVLRGHGTAVHSIAFAPNGLTLASASEDNTIRLWEPSRGVSLLTLEGHQGPVRGLAFSPDNDMLASCCDDGSVRIWHARRDQATPR